MNRCKWCGIKNQKYIDYHDKEWGKLNKDENYLYEMFILETFQAGLSWECILNKRDDFKDCYDNFDINKIINYDENKINELLKNEKIIRNKAKILASINNSKIYKSIMEEYNGFYNYLCTFTKGIIINELGKTTNKLSDDISNDLYKRGMRYVGSTIL